MKISREVNNLRKKRKRVIYMVLAAATGNALVTAAPSLDVEIAKKLFLTFTNVVMFIVIWDAYFDEQLAKKDIIAILQDLFAVTCISVITTFILSQGITKTIERAISIFGNLGWGVSGAIAGLITAIMGSIWAFYCDDLYRNSTS